MADDWYYSQNNDRKGPVTFTKLKAMAAGGWLSPDDLVWQSGTPTWLPARDVDGLFGRSLDQLLWKGIARFRKTAEQTAAEAPQNTGPPSISAEATRPTGR